MISCGIYGIECKSNGKILVGSSNHISRRYSQHLWMLRRIIHKNQHLQNAFNIYGESSFKIVILELCDEKDLLIREDYWMSNKNALDPRFGFNLKPAERPIHSKETCKKISDGKIGAKNPMYGQQLSEEHRNKISKALKGRSASYLASKETREKMSRSQMGKSLSKETKLKIGEASRNRFVTAATRLKMSERQVGEKSPMFGKKQSLETILKRIKSTQSTLLKRKQEKEKDGTYRSLSVGFKVSLFEKDLFNRMKKTYPEFNVYYAFKDALMNMTDRLSNKESFNESVILNNFEKEIKEKKVCMIQFRIGLSDKKIIDEIKAVNPEFKLACFFREVLKHKASTYLLT